MDYNRSGGGSGGRGGKKFGGRPSFGGGGGGRGFGRDRDERPTMHKATCTECGNGCEVPFKPSGDKPVFCNNCFKRDGDSDRSRGNDFAPKRSFDRGGDRGGRDWESDRPAMHQAVCTECGNGCEVPFKPSGDKPVFCNNCFKKDNVSGNRGGSSEQYKEQFEAINAKLDKIMKFLVPDIIVKKGAKVKDEVMAEETSVETEAEVKKPKVKKAAKAKKVTDEAAE